MEEKNLAEKIAQILNNKKALDIVVLDVQKMTVITDYLVIASGRSALQVKALAEEVDDKLSEEGITPRAHEGENEGRWVIMDYRGVILHIFHPEEREYYHLERLWEDGENRVDVQFSAEEE